MSRRTTLRDLVIRADPNHVRESQEVVEYEFTSLRSGNTKTHEGGKRVFRGRTASRGPYAED